MSNIDVNDQAAVNYRGGGSLDLSSRDTDKPNFSSLRQSARPVQRQRINAPWPSEEATQPVSLEAGQGVLSTAHLDPQPSSPSILLNYDCFFFFLKKKKKRVRGWECVQLDNVGKVGKLS